MGSLSEPPTIHQAIVNSCITRSVRSRDPAHISARPTRRNNDARTTQKRIEHRRADKVSPPIDRVESVTRVMRERGRGGSSQQMGVCPIRVKW